MKDTSEFKAHTPLAIRVRFGPSHRMPPDIEKPGLSVGAVRKRERAVRRPPAHHLVMDSIERGPIAGASVPGKYRAGGWPRVAPAWWTQHWGPQIASALLGAIVTVVLTQMVGSDDPSLDPLVVPTVIPVPVPVPVEVPVEVEARE